MRYPIMLLSISWFVGLILASFLSFTEHFFIVIGVCIIILVIVGIKTCREKATKTALMLIAIPLLSGAFWFGINDTLGESQLKDYFNRDVRVTGIVTGKTVTYENRVSFPLKLTTIAEGDTEEKIKETTLVNIYSPNLEKTKEQFKYGDLIHISGTLIKPSTASNPGSFDYRSYLRSLNIYSQLLVYTPEVEVLSNKHGNILVSWAIGFNESSIQLVEDILPSEQAAIMTAMVFGNREMLSEEQTQLFMNTGLMHLFAVSGLHVGFVLAFGLILARQLKLSAVPTFISTSGMILFYAAATGFSVSVTRAAIMGIIGLGAYLLRQQKEPYTVLALAALIITVNNPLIIFHVGFQLSFIATWGIMYLYSPLDCALRKLPHWRKLFVVPLAAQVALLPLLLYYFNTISPVTILANIFMTPVVGLVVISGLLIYILSFINLMIVEVLLIFVGGLLFYVWLLLQLIGNMPGSTFYFASPTIGWVAAYYASLIYFREWYLGNLNINLIKWFKWNSSKVGKVLAIFLVASLIVSQLGMGTTNEQLKIIVLDVGQGDAIFIKTPSGKTMLIDGGGIPSRGGQGFDVGNRVVVPFLRQYGIKKIDLMVNTHGHYDHTAGLIPVLENFSVKEALISPAPATTEIYEKFLQLLIDKEIPTSMAERGQKIQLDPHLTIEVFHPAKEPYYPRAHLNNSSVVIKLTYGNFSMLFTGDIELEAMAELVDSNLDLNSVIYKVSHHGSKTGLHEEFLAIVNPQIAVIPVGRNTFGHPHPELLEYFKRNSIKTYRTDIHGAVVITVNRNHLEITHKKEAH